MTQTIQVQGKEQSQRQRFGNLLTPEVDPYVVQGLVLDGSNLWVAAPKTGETRLALHCFWRWHCGRSSLTGKTKF